jgi:hypothetical protein
LRVGVSHHDHAITFSGTKVRNVKNVTIGSNYRNCTLTLSDSAEFDAESMRIASSSNGGRCKFEVLDGATATINGYFLPEDNAGYGDNCLIVDGVGSSLSVPNKDVVLGSNLSNDRMSISNGGSAALQSLTVGNGGSATNTVLTVDGASLTLGGNLVIGNSDSSCNRVEISGSSSRLQRGDPSDFDPYFGTGGFNEFHVTGGAVITNEFAKDTYIGYQSSNNIVRISDGGKLRWSANDKNVCLGNKTAVAHHNVFIVEDGGTNDVHRFVISGHDNRLVITNGTFITRRTGTGSLWVGNNNVGSGSVTPQNNGIVLCGTKPSLRIPGGLTLENSSYLRFELPAAELETVPVNFGSVSISENSALHVACDDYLSYVGNDRGNVILASASTAAKLSVSQSVLDATNAELPERCKLVVEGQELILKIARIKGTVVSIR